MLPSSTMKDFVWFFSAKQYPFQQSEDHVPIA
ncbi:hypothetical protein CIPAW_11G117000 [Carya illinoinensis]|uniref:Uncharacterized protein n=1 Tax=Carya illinoinensis TaxID=32201 RepID=A0A8T1P1E2_CARIL|nr:hypothetical protein CIPAW_11G117000 [Carya illinoinensis]